MSDMKEKKLVQRQKRVSSCHLAERENGDRRKVVLARMGRGTQNSSERWKWQEAAERDRGDEPWGQPCLEVERTRNLCRMGKTAGERAGTLMFNWEVLGLYSCHRNTKMKVKYFHWCYWSSDWAASLPWPKRTPPILLQWCLAWLLCHCLTLSRQLWPVLGGGTEWLGGEGALDGCCHWQRQRHSYDWLLHCGGL